MKYQVKVDGKVFEVEVEKVSGGAKSLTMADFGAPAQAAPQPAQPAPAPKAAPAPAPEAPKASAASTGGEQILSPMPGNIWKIVAAEGSQVEAGDVVLILEAMKMENEIVAPVSGTVSIKVNQGDNVDTDQLLAEVK
ncbi:biotin/lipoyl-containing protein [Anaerosphaera multitolerans]|uniref:Acetyl-CoA carboxylase biotin carboxyl carrier protein subunit n=1 Tax=Anaerosphaera multitolerans TaxID=2487351 RepID=A0A437S6N8_9FIRM|nr:biotin/lipoyl-containing protein [Anaerosphaera multitolerans]RVU54672.1 acetyl-CoA carboxylase biotin carboxyl carrier protein subunit [Anaerosphaera multitolerans]